MCFDFVRRPDRADLSYMSGPPDNEPLSPNDEGIPTPVSPRTYAAMNAQVQDLAKEMPRGFVSHDITEVKKDGQICHHDFVVPARYELRGDAKALGAGNYGVVALFWDSRRETSIAMKRISLPQKKARRIQVAYREFCILRASLPHPNIVDLHSAFFSDYTGIYIYLVIDFMEETLHAIIKREKTLEHRVMSLVMAQLVNGLRFLHHNTIMHMDLKPANIGVNTSKDYELKIFDFGCSRHIRTEEARRHTTLVGTLEYRAPEQLASDMSRYDVPYTFQIDMWALGCVFAEMFIGNRLFLYPRDRMEARIDIYKSQMQTILKRLAPKKPAKHYKLQDLKSVYAGTEAPTGFPEEANFVKDSERKEWHQTALSARDLLRGLLKICEDERLTANSAASHPYLSEWKSHNEQETCNDLPDGMKYNTHLDATRYATTNAWYEELISSVEDFQKTLPGL